MDITNKIRKIISDNKNEIAFIIGNGIHRYENKDSLTWDRLLIDMWNSTQSDKINTIPHGTTYTEFYDIFKMRCEMEAVEWEKDEKLLSELYGDPEFIEKCSLYEEPFDIYEIPITNEDEAEAEDDFKEEPKPNIIYYGTNIQHYISDIMKKWKHRTFQNHIVQYIRNINAPILTTNFDEILSNSVELKMQQLGRTNFSEIHPWNCVYSDIELSSPLDGFGIWHINGMINYPRSIKLGLSHYMASVNKARKMIQGNNVDLVEKFEGKNTSQWHGKNTWLHIIFNKSLIIFGLALEENEVFLRWLLLQRASYYNRFLDRTHKGWYIGTKQDKLDSKRFFLDSVGVEIIEVEDYKVIYEDLW